MPGFGLVSSTDNSTDATGFISDASSLTDDVAAVTTVLECPIGYYGAGMTIRSTCVKCPVGSTTEESGREAVSQCSSKWRASCQRCSWRITLHNRTDSACVLLHALSNGCRIQCTDLFICFCCRPIRTQTGFAAKAALARKAALDHHHHSSADNRLHLLLCASDCAVCVAGYGQQGVSTDCTPCDFGSYHPGGSIRCSQCPAAKFYAPVDGAGDIWTSGGV
jgi:hypothetical protein